MYCDRYTLPLIHLQIKDYQIEQLNRMHAGLHALIFPCGASTRCEHCCQFVLHTSQLSLFCRIYKNRPCARQNAQFAYTWNLFMDLQNEDL
jgi:hypothetical protein